MGRLGRDPQNVLERSDVWALEHAGALRIKRGVGSGSVGVLPHVFLRQGQLRHQEIGALLGYRGAVLILAQE